MAMGDLEDSALMAGDLGLDPGDEEDVMLSAVVLLEVVDADWPCTLGSKGVS